MKNALICLWVFLLYSGHSFGQQSSRTEIFGGYSLERISACGAPGDVFLTCSGFIETGNSSPATYNGWNASVTTFIHKFVGISGDFGGHYGTTVIVGKRITFRLHFSLQLHVWPSCSSAETGI